MTNDIAADFAVEYGRLVAALWKELTRHSRVHGCGFGAPVDCALYQAIRTAWLDALYMQEAFDWLAFDKFPELRDSREWVEEMKAARR